MKKYFATLPSKEIGAELVARKDQYFQHLRQCGRYDLLRKAYRTYYRPSLRAGYINRAGSQGELMDISVNHFKSLLERRLSMTTSQRPHFEPKAVNTDSKSQTSVALASGLLEYYNRIKKMERFTAQATEKAIVFGEGFIYMMWNATKGDLFTVDGEGDPVFEGDIEFKAMSTFDIIRDASKRHNSDHMWIMVKEFRNKWDMAEKYPALADRIKRLESTDDLEARLDFDDDRAVRHPDIDDDDILVYTFMHKPSEALPEGRMIQFSAEDIIYGDGPLPFKDIPVFRIAPGEQEGEIWGYSSSFDLLPLQDAIDRLNSTILTNQAAFGVQNIAIPKGSGVNILDISGGLNILEYDAKAGPPTPLNLTATPREVFEYKDQLVREMETISGINSVARGNPQASLESGAALALVQAQAIQFAQGLQQSYNQLLEDVGTGVIDMLKEFASSARVALIVGKVNQSYLKEFKGEDLLPISRVVVDMGNPLQRTTAGRVNMAELLLQQGQIKTPQQFIEVITTGRIEPVLESEFSQLMLIRRENEALKDGKSAAVLRTDAHEIHIAEHLTNLDTPEARENPELAAITLDHIAEHEDFLAQQQQQALEAQLAAEAGSGEISQSLDNTNPTEAAADSVGLPDQPIDPLTGEQVEGA